ncbi:MAG: hypothetical protein AAFW68_01545 [Pseudomonadota bacterium]
MIAMKNQWILFGCGFLLVAFTLTAAFVDGANLAYAAAQTSPK